MLTVDPRSGRHLFKIGTKFVEFESTTNEYRLVADFTKAPWPFGKHEAPRVAFIPEYGVTMWSDKKVMLRKHKICTGEPLPAASSHMHMRDSNADAPGTDKGRNAPRQAPAWAGPHWVTVPTVGSNEKAGWSVR